MQGDAVAGRMATVETPNVVAERSRAGWLSEVARAQIKEYAPTFLTEFAVMASQIVVYKLAAYFLGKQGFSEYAVARRAISTAYPIALLGFGVGLPRYIAISKAEERGEQGNRFFGATLWCVGSVAVLLVSLINLLPSRAAYLIYGNESYKAFAFPVSLIVFGLVLHAVVYSYFRGHLLMGRANFLQFTNLAIVPLLGFVGTQDAVAVLTRIGLLCITVSLTGLLFTPWKQAGLKAFAEAKLLLRYGLPRMPGDLALAALLSLPAFVVAHRVGVQEAGYVAFGTALLGIVGAVFAPIGLILLPKASGLIARGAHEELKSHISTVLQLSLVVSALLTLLAETFAGPLLGIYLGKNFVETSQTVRLVMLGAVPYAVYTALRSAIDARHFRAVNTRNCVIALGALIASMVPLDLLEGGSASALILPLPLSLLLLGILTWWEARKVSSDLVTGGLL